MQDLANAICELSETQEFKCPHQQRLIANIRMFNWLKECNCCEHHSLNKPVDITDNRAGQRFPEGDSRNYTGTNEEVANDERIDTMSDKYPRVFTFIYSDKCGCSCRSLMRSIVRRPVEIDAEECWNLKHTRNCNT